MYGHILLGVASFVQYKFGDSVWHEICKKINVDSEAENVFLNHEVYADDTLNGIINALNEILGISHSDCLEAIGEHVFTVYWRQSRHASLLEVLGRDMHGFLSNLDTLHYHLSSTFKKMTAPSFSCERKPDAALLLHYHSARKGLAPIVKGILLSVARNLFGLEVEIAILKYQFMQGTPRNHHYQFRIKLKGKRCKVKLQRLLGEVPERPVRISLQTDFNKQTLYTPPLVRSSLQNVLCPTVTEISCFNNGAQSCPIQFSAPLVLPSGNTLNESRFPIIQKDNEWPITPELFKDASPFHILFDKNLIIQSVGRSMDKLLPPNVCLSCSVTDFFQIEIPILPFTYQQIKMQCAGLFILEFRNNVLPLATRRNSSPKFRGQMIPVSNEPDCCILFLASPSVQNHFELDSMGFSITDVALHDTLHELLETNIYFQNEMNLSGELEKTKLGLEVEKAHLQHEKSRTDNLLQAMLPFQVAAELQETGNSIPMEFPEVSILFTGLRDFQLVCSRSTPLEIVKLLNCMFGSFDLVVEKYKVYKVETIGDSYMLACGLPDTAVKHAHTITEVALEIRNIINSQSWSCNVKTQLVIGIHSGPVVAGVVGIKQPRYCLFGDTVNTASRMNSTGEVGKIHISEATYKLIKNVSDYQFTNRGKIFVKGLGLRTTYFVEKQGTTLIEVHPSNSLAADQLSFNTKAYSTSNTVIQPLQITDAWDEESEEFSKDKLSKSIFREAVNKNGNALKLGTDKSRRMGVTTSPSPIPDINSKTELTENDDTELLSISPFVPQADEDNSSGVTMPTLATQVCPCSVDDDVQSVHKPKRACIIS